MGAAGTRLLKMLQLAVAAGVFVLSWLIYPGVLAPAVGLCYGVASIAAARDWRVGIWIAFTFTVLAVAFSAWGVYRYLVNGFDYLSGHFPGRAGIDWPPYLFLFVAAAGIVVVVLHVRSWRWMVHPQDRRGG